MTRETRDRKFPMSWFVSLACLLIVVGGMLWGSVEWFYNRIYVPEGTSLLLRYKGSPLPWILPGNLPQAESGRFAKVDESNMPQEKGILQQMVGPGRHFYCPLWWERQLVKDWIVEPAHVALVTSKMGDALPAGEFLVDGKLGETRHKGILRSVFGPGRYRINPYAYDVKIIEVEVIDSGGQVKQAGWVNIPTGYVGVVTNLAANPLTGATLGIQDHVLPPGIYPVNPKEQQVDVVEIGFRENTTVANLKKDRAGLFLVDESGEPMIVGDESGIVFPSNDGFEIYMDFTAIWGIMPDQAPNVIRKFGNVQAVENKVVLPQVKSLCRNMGSKLGAVELLVGESRRKFQEDTSEAFKHVLHEKDITLLYGLVRHIYIPQEVRLPIQEAFIADEKKLTLEQQQQTKRTEALLKEATAKVELEAERIRVETEKQVAMVLAEGGKTAEQTRAQTVQMEAAIDKQTAALEAQATILIGEAEASATRMLEEATADRFKLAVEAFGTGEAYNLWVFASGLPDDIRLNMLYAGEGTFWTDLKGFTNVLLGRQMQETTNGQSSPSSK